MRRACLLLSVSLLIAHALQAGSYPPGPGTQTFEFAAGTVDLGDGAMAGSNRKTSAGSPVAGVYENALRLADKDTPNAIGSFKLPELDPGSVIKVFDLRFTVLMEGPVNAPWGEGWSLNFGRIPEDDGTGEDGFAPLPGGLTIAFDAGESENDPSSIEVFIGGVSIANSPRAFPNDSSSRPVVLHWDSNGLDLTYDSRTIFSDLATPGFAPGVGHRFAFSARTTSATMDVRIDNVRTTTQSLPVIETGGPVISEFVANNTAFEDEFADKPGWVEILNGSAAALDLTGWYLTDSKRNLAKWKITGSTLGPYNYQVVFASGRDRQLSATSWMHTNFKLAKSEGYIALVKPDGKTIASAYEYGPQDKNVAFGEKGAERKVGYMFPASPGQVNTAEPAKGSFSPDVEFSHPGGLILAPVTLTLTAPKLAGAELRYTLDRTEPGPASPLYSQPFAIDRFAMVRARVYVPGHLPGRVSSRTFLMMDDTLADYAGTGKVFDSNLPLVFVDTFGFNVDGSTGGSRPFRPSYAVVIGPDAKTGRASLSTTPDYAGPSGVHIRGESSAGFEQRSYALELWDESSQDLDAPLLGMPAESDWTLIGPWSEKSLMRNKMVFDWMLTLRGYDGMAVRSRFVELFLHQARPASGKVGYTSYRGIYLMTEKLKRGRDRVPLENLNDKTVDPELITGGYIIRKDKDDAQKSNWTTARFAIPLQSFDPDRFNAAQLGYIRTYINSFEAALNSANFQNPITGYQAYIDPDTFIDAQWLLEISKQVDGYVFSTYFHKDRGGRLRAGPIWDFNISLGNADYASGDRATGWLYDGANGVGQLWYPRLHNDPEYKLAHWDRYWQMRRTFMANEAVLATIHGHMATLLDGYTGAVSNRAPVEIQNPVARHFRKWPRLGMRDWPNPAAETRIRTWQAEVDYMKEWLLVRLEWLDDQSLRAGRVVFRPPVLSHAGGQLSAPVTLSMAPYRREDRVMLFAEGDIYYTLDNSDPRLPGGDINPSAIKYSGELAIRSSATVNARLLSQRQWTPLATSTFFYKAVPADSANLTVSEIHYDPAAPTATETAAGISDAKKFEFLELRNVARQAVDLSGVKLTDGVQFDFNFVPVASRLLRSGESAVLVADKRAFSIRYPHVPVSKILGQFQGQLDNGGEKVAILGADGRLIREFRYDNNAPWPIIGDSSGRSLVLMEPALNPNPGEPSRWTLSARAGGTPGESGGGADIFVGDPFKDTDGDSLTDLFEFATGSDPENPSSRFPLAAFIAPFEVNGVKGDYLMFEYRRRPAAQGVKMTIESSANLRAWGSADAVLTRIGARENRDGTVTETYRGTEPWSGTSDKALFLRLLVQQQP